MADYIYLTDTGVVVPDTDDIKTGVETEFKEAFGLTMPVTSDTPQGVLISAETSARVAVVQNNAQLANQINPNEAGGIFLDGICALLGLTRLPATRTQVVGVTLTGKPLTLIPLGTNARTTGGDLFTSTAVVTLSAAGVATADFQAVDTGPVTCAVGALSGVVTSVLGWESITNALAGTLGENQQSDESLRALRRVTLARQGISANEAIISDIYALPGVKSLSYRENVAAVQTTVDGVSMSPHALFACVDGGVSADIAKALLANKTVGAAFNGTTTVNVTDEFSGQIYPVKFYRPSLIAIYINITIRKGLDLSDPMVSVPLAILNGSLGAIPDEKGFTVGAAVSAFEIGAYVNYYHPQMQVKDVKIFKLGVTPSTDEIAMTLLQKAFTALAYVTVTLV